AVVALAIAWLPDQTSAGALRAWLCAGALPCLILWQGGLRGGLSWLLLAATALISGTSTAVWLATWQLGWWAALLLGRHAPARHSAIAAAGALAALPAWYDPNGLFGNPDYVAAFVALCVPSAWVMMTQDRRWAIVLVAMLGALVHAQSLGAWAALAVVAVIALAIHRRWAAVALLGLLAIAGALGRESVATHLEGRAHLAGVTARVARTAAFVGLGAGQLHGAFLVQQARTLDDAALWTNAHHAHAEPLQVVAEQGLLGLALLCLPILIALRRPWTTHHATVGVGVILGAVTLPLYMPGVCLLVAHGLGAALGPSAATSPIWRWPARLLGAGLLLIATSQLMTDRMLARADRTADAPLAETAARWSLRPASALRVAAGHQPASAHALALADAANAIDPSVEGIMLRGQILHQTGEFAGAEEAFRRAVHLHRWLFAGWFNLSRTLEDQGDRPGARAAAKRARALRPSDERLRHLPP
ncbi:MAG: tetratricopeptide (TPR) repeat protein, partial [Bradymonadia bacterium]